MYNIRYGKSFEEFLKSGELKNFSGFQTVPAKYHEEHFEEAPLRIMSFADTYGNMYYDCTQSMNLHSTLSFQLSYKYQ